MLPTTHYTLSTLRRYIALVFSVSLAFTFHLSPFTLIAQQLPLGEGAKASLITCGPGNDFYTTFGHTAIRISDTARGVDRVYNYGTFDFDTPHFYWKFAQGRLNYCLSRSNMLSTVAMSEMEGRELHEQELRMTTQEVNNLYVMLEWNYEPENRYYRYDFFSDNCATRVRDMLEAASGRVRKVESGKWKVESGGVGSSYRRMVHEKTSGGCLEWWTLGVDLLFGLPADKQCSERERMFLPSELYDFVERKGMVESERKWLDDGREPMKKSFPPAVVFGLLFAVYGIGFTVYEIKSKSRKVEESKSHSALPTTGYRLPAIIDRVIFVLCGILGLLLLFMWFGTDHYCTAWNPNILWASPLLILIAIRMERSPKWALWLQEVCLVVATVWAVVCGVSLGVVLMIATLLLRIGTLLFLRGRRVA